MPAEVTAALILCTAFFGVVLHPEDPLIGMMIIMAVATVILIVAALVLFVIELRQEKAFREANEKQWEAEGYRTLDELIKECDEREKFHH